MQSQIFNVNFVKDLRNLDAWSALNLVKEHKWWILGSSVVGYGLMKWLQAPRNLPPGPVGLPFVGAIHQMSEKIHLDYSRLAQKYGDVFCMYIGRRCVYIPKCTEKQNVVGSLLSQHS